MPFLTRDHLSELASKDVGMLKKTPVVEEPPIVPFLLMFVSFLFMLATFLIVAIVQRCCCSRRLQLTDDDDDDSTLLYDEMEEASNDATALLMLSPDDQEMYFQAKEFVKLNGFARMNLANWQKDVIKDKGVHAWCFTTAADTQHSIMIENKNEITFNTRNIPISIQSNLPIPDSKDVHYIEFKIFDIPEQYKDNTLISLGLSTHPYPSFALPGRYLHSVAYDSNGDRRHNCPFPISDFKDGRDAFPHLEKGDVIGIGLRRQTRAVFFTRNGKKISESRIGGHVKLPRSVQLYPTVGSINPCRVDVNFGQMGFVFIEANVKKWALGPMRGDEAPPPLYKKFNHDVLLDTSDTEDNELPEFEEIIREHEMQPAYFTDDDIGDDEVTLKTLKEPPNYDNLIENEIREAMEDSIDELDTSSS